MSPTLDASLALQGPDSLGRDLQRFLAARLRCRETAADLAQETLLRLHLCAQRDLLENPRAMAFRIAQHLLIDHQRKTVVRRRYDSGEDLEAVAETAACPRPGPEEAAQEQQRLERLALIVAELPPDCRTAFLLHGVEGLSYAEIAERLGISKSMVGKHLARAILHCKRALDE